MNDDALIARERVKFEEWCAKVGASTELWMENRPQSGYKNLRVQDYWTGWLECARATARGVAGVSPDAQPEGKGGVQR